ncbi:MAG: DUF2752 domain-containing protein [Brumimicrobium sp.]|nr:DUF2752 domain-containing protein [Brumimicrobium sp.]
MEEYYLQCSIKETLGVECPGCGTQRSFYALIHGDFIESFLYNPGVILFIITVIAGCWVYFYKTKLFSKVVITGFSLTAVAMFTHFVIKLIHH